MPITKNDLNNLQKSLISEISKFLEDHVINKLFKLEKDVGILKKDVKELKHDVEQIDRKLGKSIERADRHGKTIENHEERITSLEQPKFT